MKSDTQLLIVVALIGLAGWYLVSHRSQLGLGAPQQSERDRLRAIIGNIPGDPRFLPKQDKLTLAQGAISGASTGAIAGPWGAGIGAAGGAIASFFI